MLNVSNNQAKKINSNTRSLADGITKMPFFVPQFKDGGEVSLKDRLPTAYKESGNQARQLRYNVQNPPGKTYIQPTPKPDPYAVKVGPQSDYRFQNSQPPAAKLGPTVVDSQLVGNVANSLANSSTGPYKEKLQAAFPPQNGQSREGSLAQKILGYKDGGPVEPMLEKDEYGMIEGPGTGTSDDIPAELTEGDYIIPAQAVQAFGEENLMRLIHAVMGNEMMEGEGEPVDAMVSNGEIRVPPEVVEKLGAGFFDAIKSASGMDTENGDVKGYADGGFVDDEEKKKFQGYSLQGGLDKFVGGVEQGFNTGVNAVKNKFDEVGQRAQRNLANLNPTPQQNPAYKNVLTSLSATDRRLQDEAAGNTLALQRNTPSDPNIYGPGGRNFGPNPTTEQRQELFGSASLAQPSELDQFKQFAQAQADIQNEANRKDRLDQQFYLDRYGSAPNSQTNVDSRSALIPQELKTQRGIAGLSNQTELAKIKSLADTARYQVDQPKFNARITDSGDPLIYQESGIGAENRARQQQLGGDQRAQNALKYLQDPNADQNKKSVAMAYLKSLGLI